MTEAKLDPNTFDLDGWLDGVQRPRDVVTLHARRDLMPRIDELVAELEPLVAQRDADKPDVSLAEVGTDTARIDDLRAQLRYLWAQYEASGVVVELTQLDSETVDDIIDQVRAAYPDPPADASDEDRLKVMEDRNQLNSVLIVTGSVTAVYPHGKDRVERGIDADTLAKMRKRFGLDQITDLIGRARTLTFEGRVDAPFSRRVSAVLTETPSD